MHPWEQQADETAKAFAAFALFRDAGAARSLDSCYRSTRGRKRGVRRVSGRAPGCWTRWYRDHHWADRAQAYDAHCDALQRETREQRFAQLASRRAEYELRHQERLEALVERMDQVLLTAEKQPVVDTVSTKTRKGVKTYSKRKGINFAGYAKLITVLCNTALQAMLGPRPATNTAGSGTQPAPQFELERLRALSDDELQQLTDAARRLSQLLAGGDPAPEAQ